MYAEVVVIRADGVEERWALRQRPPGTDVQVFTIAEEHRERMRHERGDDWLSDEPATLVPLSHFEVGVDYHVDPDGCLLIYQTAQPTTGYVAEMARYAPGAWIRAQRVRPRTRDRLALSEAAERAWRASDAGTE